MVLKKTDPNTIATITSSVEKGEVVVLPCDTIYGLSSIYGKGEAALKALKGRDASKPFLVLATLEQAKELCEDIPDDILAAWPASLTVILNKKGGGTIGVRVPDDPFLQKLLESIKSPIYSTSVNISGEPSLLSFTDINAKFGDKVSYIVKGQETQGTTASTLINATEKPYKLIRQGSYDASRLI